MKVTQQYRSQANWAEFVTYTVIDPLHLFEQDTTNDLSRYERQHKTRNLTIKNTI